jgi:hypothetical protein
MFELSPKNLLQVYQQNYGRASDAGLVYCMYYVDKYSVYVYLTERSRCWFTSLSREEGKSYLNNFSNIFSLKSKPGVDAKWQTS